MAAAAEAAGFAAPPGGLDLAVRVILVPAVRVIWTWWPGDFGPGGPGDFGRRSR